MAESSAIFKRNYLLSVLLAITLLFNLGMMYQNRYAAEVPDLHLYNTTSNLHRRSFDAYIHVAFFGKYAYRNMKIIRGVARTYHTILEHTESPVYLHVLLDLNSKQRTARTLKSVARTFKRKLNVTFYDANEMARQNQDTIDIIRRHFFSKDVGRYNDSIFFLTEIFHEAFPRRLHKIIFLDVDLIFKEDIHKLHVEFSKFSEDNVIGIGPDLQPQYRMDFSKYRNENPNTTVGSPRPGLQGFNTGVVLFDLDRMRKSDLYNSLINSTVLEDLCKKYKFNGYLGHQDFFSLTGMEYPQLYYKLDCSWNRQLDVGWKKVTGKKIFDLYHKCDGKINVLHANGDSKVPFDKIM